jgi:hypothetical protein
MKKNYRNIRVLLLTIAVLTAIATSQVLGANYTVIDLGYGTACGVSGTQQVGNTGNATLWSGSAASRVDLNPSGFATSEAKGTNGTKQVGFGSTTAGGYDHALLWSGSAASYVDLHPANGYYASYAYGISGTQQVGYSWSVAANGNSHAMLWNGTAASYVDLHPSISGFTSTYAYGTNGTKQVGWTYMVAGGVVNSHALLWSGTAASRVDLNPTGFSASLAFGTNGTQQVGYGNGSATGGTDHALLWSGTAASFVDLNQFLPAGFIISCAQAIDSYGNIAGYARDNSGNYHAILWQVPEPATILLIAFGGLLLRKRR